MAGEASQRSSKGIEMATEAQSKCISAGMSLFREHTSFRKASPILFAENLRGLVPVEDLKITHSELAHHVKAAGKDILAFALVGRGSVLVAFDDGEGKCGFTYGGDHELLSPALVDKVNEIWEKRGPD